MGSDRRQRQQAVKVRVTDDEKATLHAEAKKAGLSLASYVRNVSLHYPVRSQYDLDAIRDMHRITGDLNRLGGLLKMWLTNDERFEGARPSAVDVQMLHAKIDDTVTLLKQSAKRVLYDY